jgi:predicted secreted protein
MLKMNQLVVAAALSTCMAGAYAVQTNGAEIKIAASGEVIAPNDQARVTLTIEEQDKDKAAAASRVNQKMNKGQALIKTNDSQAVLKTQGYFTYPVYSETEPKAGQSRQIIGWRVGQSLSVTTTNLANLSKTVAAVQGTLALNGIQFDLSPATQKKQDAALIEDAYKNLIDRVNAITRAMGRNPQDATLDSVDMIAEGGGGVAPRAYAMRADAVMAKESHVVEPSFEPGESVLSMQIVGKVKLK